MSALAALLRASLLILFALAAIGSNIAHAAAPLPAPVATYHHQPAGHSNHDDAPCCATGMCIGCALPTADVPVPVAIAALAAVPHPASALAAQTGFTTPPALPPPRT